MFFQTKLNGFVSDDYSKRFCHWLKSLHHHQTVHQQFPFPFSTTFDLNFLNQLSSNDTSILQQSFQVVQQSNWISNSQELLSHIKNKTTQHQLLFNSKKLENINQEENGVQIEDLDKEGEEEVCALSVTPTTEKSHSDADSLSKDSKRRRTSFTSKQLLELEREFITKKYLSLGERAQLARTLRLSQEQIKVWFQNRRAKWKRSKGYRGGSNTDQESGVSGAGAKTICSSSNSATGASTHKIYVPIPVHVDRVRLRSQQQQIEKRMSSALANKKKNAVGGGDPFAVASNLMPPSNGGQLVTSSIAADHRSSSLQHCLGPVHINSQSLLGQSVFGSTVSGPSSFESYSNLANKANFAKETVSKSELLPSVNSAFQVPIKSNNLTCHITNALTKEI